jgi:hypothetical protein
MIHEERNGYRFIDRRADAPALNGAKSMSIGLFATPRSTGQHDYYRPRPFPNQNTSRVSDYEWRELVTFSRQLFAQMAQIAYAICQKNIYAIGDAWKPYYCGENDKWGQEAEEWLTHEWYPNCDIRGGVFDFTTSLLLTGIALDLDGDDAMVLMEDENRFPKLRFVQSMDIGTRTKPEVKDPKSPLDGANIQNGILLDRNDGFLGIQVLGSDENEDVIVPAYNCHFLFEPEFRSLFRGVPRMSKSILDAFDKQDIDAFLKRIVKLHSSRGIIHTTTTGDAPDGGDVIVPRGGTSGDFSAPTGVRVEKVMGGEIFYLQAGADEKMEAFRSDVPHPNVEAFITRLERSCMNALGWFHELADPSNMRGASVRLIQDQARHSIAARQRSLKARAKRAVQFAIARAMELGLVSRNYDGMDSLKWGFNLPAQLTVDAGYDEQADQENLRMGTTTMAAICEKKGKWWEEIRSQRVRENVNLIDAAIALVQYAGSKGQVITFREALGMMQQDSVMPEAKPAGEDPEDKAREKAARDSAESETPHRIRVNHELDLTVKGPPAAPRVKRSIVYDRNTTGDIIRSRLVEE